MSSSTRDLSGAEELWDLGDQRLEDLTAPERIYQLGVAEDDAVLIVALEQFGVLGYATEGVGMSVDTRSSPT